jgi:HEAT repeat protein
MFVCARVVMVAAVVATAAAPAGQARAVRDLIGELAADDPMARARASCDLKEQGDRALEAVQPLIKLLGDATPIDGSVCRERAWHGWNQQTSPGQLAAAALVGIGSRAVEPLIGVLQQPLWIARRNAVWALGALDDSRAVAPVTAALRDREPGVRENAAWALGAMDASEAVQGLVGALKDVDDRVRKQAAWALGAIGDREAVTGLLEALRDSSKEVREQAAWALGAIGDSRASSGLVAALKDSSADVRRQAAWALGAIGR